MRPFFPFYGSKWNIARHYPRPGSRVVEPFAGSAGYSTYWDVPHVDLFDADPIIAGVWSYLLSVKPSEIMALPLIQEAGDGVDNYALPQEAKWLIGFWLNRGSASPKKTRTAYSARSDKAQLNWGQRAKERIAGQLHMIAGWSITNAPFDAADDVDCTWYIDPPYADKGRYYRVKFTDFDRLAAWVRTRQGSVIVCEGPGATWLPFEPLGDFKSSKGHAKEVVFLAGQEANDAFALVAA